MNMTTYIMKMVQNYMAYLIFSIILTGFNFELREDTETNYAKGVAQPKVKSNIFMCLSYKKNINMAKMFIHIYYEMVKKYWEYSNLELKIIKIFDLKMNFYIFKRIKMISFLCEIFCIILSSMSLLFIL